jgi:excisionase family DNA binding protein
MAGTVSESAGSPTSQLVASTTAHLETLMRSPEDLRLRTTSPWLSANEAAAYLRCPLSRVRKLTMTGDLPHEHDGRRVLYHRDELDSFIRSGGAKTP